MTRSLRGYFAPPVFPGDDELTLRAKHVTAIINVVAFSAILYTVVMPILAPEIAPRMVLIIPLYPILAVLYVLIRRKRIHEASLTLVIGTWLVLLLSAATSGGAESPAFAGNIIIILCAAVLLNQRTAIIFALLSAVEGIAMAYGVSIGYLERPPSVAHTPTTFWLAEAIYFGVAVALLRMATENIRLALQKAQRELEERRRVEQELQEQRDFAAQVLDNLGQGVTVTDVDAKFEYINPAYTKMLNTTQADLTGKSPFDLAYRNDLPKMEQARIQREQGQATTYEMRLLRSTGEIVHTLITGVPRWKNGKYVGAIAVITDLTERKQAENEQAGLLEKIQRHNVQLQTAAEVSRAASSTLELDLLLPRVVELIQTQFNYYYVGLFLYDKNTHRAVLRAATGDMGRKMLEEGYALDIHESSMIGWCITHAQPRFALDVGADPVRFKNPHLPLTRSELAFPLIAHGEVIGAMTIQSSEPSAFSTDDIVALQTMVEQISNAIQNATLFAERVALNAELQSRNLELERFTYTVSHDLRSPLITIRGFVGLLQQDAAASDAERLQKDVQRIVTATEKMQQLLNELLELSRVGRVTNPMRSLPFRQIVEEALERVQGPIESRGARIKIQDALPAIFGDPTRLIEVVQNLVDNAVKFMGGEPNPLVEIGAAGDDAEGRTIFFVRDNGIGIDPQFHEQVFGLFNKLNVNSEGTGVGLALVKRIIEVHGGKIWVESAGANGSTFYFSLPKK